MGGMSGVVVAGSLAQKPGQGGHAWVFLQYLLGFQKLGFDVLFLDRLDPHMAPDGDDVPHVSYLRDVMAQFDLAAPYNAWLFARRASRKDAP